jgi:hypothetical protein
MKQTLTLVFCISVFSGFSQTWQSNSTPSSPQVESIYRNDAVKAAARRLFEINSPFKDSVEVPHAYLDSVTRVFYAIQNLPQTPLKDTIINMFGYSNFNAYGAYFGYENDSLHYHNNGTKLNTAEGELYGSSPKILDMYVPDTATWVAQWQAGNYTNTTNPAVNELALRYGIMGTNYTTLLTGQYHFSAITSRAVNTVALAKAFNTLIGDQQAARPATYTGDGNSIELVYEADGIKIIYTNQCGNCPVSCSYGRSWTFRVSLTNYSVEYLDAINIGITFPPGNPVSTCTRGPVLPVAFGAVNGYLQSGKTTINWKVVTQLNVREYIIERSDNAMQFYTAGTMGANKNLTAEYTWKEEQLLTGTAWYRIKAVDADGKVKYSSIVKLSNAKTNSFTVYPNPVTNNVFTVQFATPLAGKAQVELYNLSGSKVWSSSLILAPQVISRTLTLPVGLPGGMYALVVNGEGVQYKQTITVISDK